MDYKPPRAGGPHSMPLSWFLVLSFRKEPNSASSVARKAILLSGTSVTIRVSFNLGWRTKSLRLREHSEGRDS